MVQGPSIKDVFPNGEGGWFLQRRFGALVIISLCTITRRQGRGGVKKTNLGKTSFMNDLIHKFISCQSLL